MLHSYTTIFHVTIPLYFSGYKDTCSDGFRAGCAELLTTIQNRVKPKYHVFGHIHEGTKCCTLESQTLALGHKALVGHCKQPHFIFVQGANIKYLILNQL